MRNTTGPERLSRHSESMKLGTWKKSEILINSAVWLKIMCQHGSFNFDQLPQQSKMITLSKTEM